MALLVLGLQGASIVARPPSAANAATMTLVITASADTYVDSSAPSTAFGTQTSISADASPTRYVFLRFDLSAVTGTITAATLRLHAQDSGNAASPAGGTVRKITGNTWSEAATTYNNRPSTSGTTVGSFGAVARNTWYQLNALAVGRVGHGRQPVDRLDQHRRGDYDARETGANGPQLVLTIETGPSSTVTLTSIADTYVENGTAAGTNFGTATTIVADNSPIRQAFLRFDLRAVPTIGSAKLRLHVANNSERSESVRRHRQPRHRHLGRDDDHLQQPAGPRAPRSSRSAR